MQIDDFSKVFLHVQNDDGQCYFSQIYIFVIKCAPFLLKIGEVLILMVEKKIEISEIHFKTHLSTLFQTCF